MSVKHDFPLTKTRKRGNIAVSRQLFVARLKKENPGGKGEKFNLPIHFEIPRWCYIPSIFDHQKVMVMSGDIGEKTKKTEIKIIKNTRALNPMVAHPVQLCPLPVRCSGDPYPLSLARRVELSPFWLPLTGYARQHPERQEWRAVPALDSWRILRKISWRRGWRKGWILDDSEQIYDIYLN